MNINKVSSERQKLNIQMHASQLFAIVRALKPPVNFLVFGLGNDSIFWFRQNKGGRTVFIEDKIMWYFKIKIRYFFLEAYLVNYNTRLTDWKSLINCPKKLILNLPNNVLNTRWDFILVDGPAGYSDEKTGRMKSIYMASKLIRRGGDVFVHDVDREVEREYCKKFLREKNLVGKVSRGAILHHYKIG